MKKSTSYALTIFLGLIMLVVGGWSILQMLVTPVHLSSIPDEEMAGFQNKMLLFVALRIGLMLCGFVLVLRGVVKILKSTKSS